MANQYDEKLRSLRSRRDLLQAMTERGMQPAKGQMVGQVYVGPSLLDTIAGPLMALAGQYGQERLNKEEDSLMRERNAGLVEAMSGLQGKQGMDFTTSALSSDYPEIQDLGRMNFAASLKEQNRPVRYGKSLQTVSGPNGELVNVLVGDDGSIKQVENFTPYEKPQFVGGEAVLPSKVTIGQLYGREPQGTKVNINMPELESARDKKLGALEAEQIDAARQKRLAAQRTFNMAEQLEKLDRGGVLSGPTAKPAMFVGQLARGLGFSLPPETQQILTNSENYDQTIGTQLADMILNSSAGRGFTDTDREYVKNSFPSLMQSPEGRASAIKFLKDASIRGADEGKAIEEGIRSGKPLEVDPTGGRMDLYRNRNQPPQTFNIQTEEEYNGLPSGALYVGPDGKTRRKQ